MYDKKINGKRDEFLANLQTIYAKRNLPLPFQLFEQPSLIFDEIKQINQEIDDIDSMDSCTFSSCKYKNSKLFVKRLDQIKAKIAPTETLNAAIISEIQKLLPITADELETFDDLDKLIFQQITK